MSHRPLALEISCGRIIGGEPIGYKSRSAQFQRAEWYIHPCRGIVRTSSQSLMGRQESMRGPHPTGNAVSRFQLAVEVSFARSITDVNLKPPPNVFHGERQIFRFYQRAASYRRVFAPRALIVP